MTIETNHKARPFVSVAVQQSFENRPSAAPFRRSPVGAAFRNQVLAALPAETLNELRPFLEAVRLSGQENIHRADEAVDFVYFCETAVVSEFRILHEGETSEIGMTGREGGVGLLSVFGARRAVNWTRVLIPGDAYRIRSERLKDRMAGDALLRNAILRFIAVYIEQISTRAVCKRFHALEQRICGWLLMVDDRTGTQKLPLMHEQIGASLGVQRPCVGNAARELKKKNIIDYARGKMTVLDREALKRLACDCYAEIND
jgi:CRP-like cAMP-binding protein